jgi:ribosomal protein S6--L-glutamate ligase
MPLAVASQLRRWGHDVDLLEPHATVTPLLDLVAQRYDAYVLKTASEGPGLSLREAAEAARLPHQQRAVHPPRPPALLCYLTRSAGKPARPPVLFHVWRE